MLSFKCFRIVHSQVLSIKFSLLYNAQIWMQVWEKSELVEVWKPKRCMPIAERPLKTYLERFHSIQKWWSMAVATPYEPSRERMTFLHKTSWFLFERYWSSLSQDFEQLYRRTALRCSGLQRKLWSRKYLIWRSIAKDILTTVSNTYSAADVIACTVFYYTLHLNQNTIYRATWNKLDL